MPSISSPGLGSGLDVNSIITQLMQVESQPLTALTKKEASYQAKLSAFGTMQGALSSLQTAARTLQSSSTFTGKSASVSDSSVLSASAVLTASSGTYDIGITKLAKSHVIHSDGSYSLTHTFNGGSLSFLIGATDDGIGHVTGGTTTNVTITDGSTLTQIRDAVNEAAVGVRASVVNDGTYERLIFSSNTTGTAGNIRITASQTGADVDKKNITDFDYLGVDGGMKQDRPPDNANFTVNGLLITRSSNTVTDAISGVTMALAKEGSSATITVAPNTDNVSNAVNNFVKAYNDVIGQLRTMTAYDATNKRASVLTGDSTARNIQSQLSSTVLSSVTGIAGSIGGLSDIGVAVQKDGTLAVNSSTLAATLADPDKDVASLFTQATTGNQGIAVRFYTLLDGLIGTDGLISSRTDGITASIKSVQKRTIEMNQRLADIEKRYRSKFTALDTLMASMQKTSSFLTQQLANLPSTN